MLKKTVLINYPFSYNQLFLFLFKKKKKNTRTNIPQDNNLEYQITHGAKNDFYHVWE